MAPARSVDTPARRQVARRRSSSLRPAAYALLGLAFASSSPSAHAQVVRDRLGDFIPSYIGPRGPDLDVVTTQVRYNGVNFNINATLNGAIGQTPGGVYVFGFQRGQGVARFGPIAPGVLFDSVVVVMPNGTATVRDLVTGTATVLSPGSVVINGNSLSVTVPVSLLPSQGLVTPRFGFNLWPRSGLTNNNQIADFAPDNSMASLILDFPTPIGASAQTEIAIDNASFAFQRVTSRLRERRFTGPDAPQGGLGVFLEASGRRGDGLSGSLIGRATTGEITGGIDYAFTPGLVVGAAISFSDTSARLNGGSRLDADGRTAMLFAGWSGENLHLDAYAAYSSVDFSSRRSLLIGTTQLTATAKPEGSAYSVGAAAGYTMRSGGLSFGPLVDIVLTRAKVDGYGEAGALEFGSDVDPRRRDSARIGLGGEIAHTGAHSWGSLTAHARARLVQEAGDRSDTFAARFSAQPENSFVLQGPRTTGTYGVVDLGADARAGGATVVGVSYSPRFDKDGFVDHAARASVHVTF